MLVSTKLPDLIHETGIPILGFITRLYIKFWALYMNTYIFLLRSTFIIQIP